MQENQPTKPFLISLIDSQLWIYTDDYKNGPSEKSERNDFTEWTEKIKVKNWNWNWIESLNQVVSKYFNTKNISFISNPRWV